MSQPIFLSNVRLSFPHLTEPQKTPNPATGTERISYNCEFIMPQDHDGFKQFMKMYGEMALEKWKEHAQTVMSMIQTDRKTRCYGMGAEKVSKKTFKIYDGYDAPNAVFITAGRDTPPQIIQADGSPIDPSNTMAYQQLTRKMYGGCRVNAAVRPWLQANQYGNGVRCDLIAIQFFADDTPFGEGAVDVSGIFGAVVNTNPAFGGSGNTSPVQNAMPTPPFGGMPSFLS